MIKNNIERLRTQKNKTKAHLARQVGVDRSTITRLEQGVIQPSGELMFKFSIYFKCKIEELFYFVNG